MPTLEEAQELLRIADKALALPAPGVHVGAGRHVEMPETWDGQGEPPPGWTATAAAIVDRGDGNAELPLGELGSPVRAALRRAEAVARLTAEEAAKLAAVVHVPDPRPEIEPTGESESARRM